jgi:hypothetical protein
VHCKKYSEVVDADLEARDKKKLKGRKGPRVVGPEPTA